MPKPGTCRKLPALGVGVEMRQSISETDFIEDLKKFDFPTLVLHGEDDQIVPVKDSAKRAVLMTIPG